MYELGYDQKKQIDLNEIALAIFTMNMCLIFSFVYSNGLKITLLLGSIVLLFIKIIFSNSRLNVGLLSFLWFLFVSLLIINSVLKSELHNLIYFDLIIYIAILFFLLCFRVDVESFQVSINIIVYFAFFYAIGSIFQLLNSNGYNDLILPLYDNTERNTILKLSSNGYYSGFSFQVSNTAGYLVYGIAAILFNLFRNRSKYLLNKTIHILGLLLMGYSLLLTGKRAHVLFLILSLIITYIITSHRKVIIKRLIKIITTICIIGVLLFSVFILVNKIVDLSNFGFISKIEQTIDGIRTGDDITSGRDVLYQYSISKFQEYPIFGAGWWEVRNSSIGLINDNKGSHPHNIYLQLLSELGITGLIVFLTIILYTFIKTISLLKKRQLLKTFDISLIKYSIFLQLFFIMYGFTGNVLTDHNFLLFYIFATAISITLNKKLRSI